MPAPLTPRKPSRGISKAEEFKLKPKQIAFLNAIENTGGRIMESSKIAGIGKNTHYKWLDTSPEYAKEFEKSFDRSMDAIREEIVRRAMDGEAEDVYYQGNKVGERKRRSDLLIMFEAKRRDPAYRDNYGQGIGVFAGGNATVVFKIPRPEDNKEVIDGEVIEVGPDKPVLEAEYSPLDDAL